jgi:hypothetical protein
MLLSTTLWEELSFANHFHTREDFGEKIIIFPFSSDYYRNRYLKTSNYVRKITSNFKGKCYTLYFAMSHKQIRSEKHFHKNVLSTERKEKKYKKYFKIFNIIRPKKM